MRKTILYWDPSSINILEAEAQKFKVLSKEYFEFSAINSVPLTYSHHNDYIKLISSSAFLTKIDSAITQFENNIQHKDCQLYHRNLIGVIVYCLKSDEHKKKYISDKYQEVLKMMKVEKQAKANFLLVTNDFNEIISHIVYVLGYDQNQFAFKVVNEGERRQRSDEKLGRFMVQQEFKKVPEVIDCRQMSRSLRNIEKSFALGFNIERVEIDYLKKQVEKQLKLYFKQENALVLDKQFLKIRNSNTLRDLCQAIIYFYSLEKLELYKHLNFLLRNIRSVTFDERFSQLKLLAFLLLLNYHFAYFPSEYSIQTSNKLYRYSDSEVSKQLTGKTVFVPSFYSVTSCEDLPNFFNKKTKFIITPLQQNYSSTLKSLMPVYLFSAYRQQNQFLYLPFTIFEILHISHKKNQTVVHMKEIPNNPIIRKIFDINFETQHPEKMSQSEWELYHQQRYESTKDCTLKAKVSYNIGVLHYRFFEKYHIAEGYLKQALSLSTNKQLNLNILNSLGALSLKINQKDKAENYYLEAIKQCNNFEKQKDKIQKRDRSNYFKAVVMNNIAGVAEERAEYKQAMNRYEESLRMVREQGNMNSLLSACIYNNMGFCFYKSLEPEMSKDNLKQCLQFYMKSLKLYSETYALSVPEFPFIGKQSLLPNIIEIVPVLENLSELAQNLFEDHYAQSIICLKQAIRIFKDSNIVPERESETLFYMQCRLAALYNLAEKFSESIDLYLRLVPLARSMDETGRNCATLKMNIGSIYFNIDGVQKQNQKIALKYLQQAVEQIKNPLLSQNLDLYNKICDMKEELKTFASLSQ